MRIPQGGRLCPHLAGFSSSCVISGVPPLEASPDWWEDVTRQARSWGTRQQGCPRTNGARGSPEQCRGKQLGAGRWFSLVVLPCRRYSACLETFLVVITGGAAAARGHKSGM